MSQFPRESGRLISRLTADPIPPGGDLPTGGDKDDNGDDNGATDGGTGGDRDLVHVAGGRGDGAHLPALVVVDVLGGDVDVLQGDDADDDALLGGHVLDLELAFAGLERGALLEGFVAKEAVDDAEAEDVARLRVPLDDDGAVLAEGVLHLHLVGGVQLGLVVGGGGALDERRPLLGRGQWLLWLVLLVLLLLSPQVGMALGWL